MIWNDEWERENQSTLKEWYGEQKPYEHYTWEVRKILCGGCHQFFYTRIHAKNTAIMPLVGGLPITDISARNACKPVKIACAPSAVSPLLLNAPMPSIVAIPVVKRHIAKVSRLSQRVKMDTWHNRYASAKPR